jgi:hypothetical protein
MFPTFATIEHDGWTLLSGEERQASSPDTFSIPDRLERESLSPGDAAQLLFDIETRDGGRRIDRGVDRLWVIVKTRTGKVYRGVLDSDPGWAQGLSLRSGIEVNFLPEHVIRIARPPDGYVRGKYGPAFFAPPSG